MNPLQTLHEATIAKERTMTTDTANDRREGYCDGLSRKWQIGRSAAYRVANHDGRRDAARMLEDVLTAPPVSAWQRVIGWLRAILS